MTRIELFKKALVECQRLLQQYPDEQPLKSVENQLLYLIDLEEGRRHDQKLLARINLGLIAVREIEDLDLPFAELLHKVSAQADQMRIDAGV
ncbi:MAG: immunity protein Tsi6 family protein [Blastocatellia bacterium]